VDILYEEFARIAPDVTHIGLTVVLVFEDEIVGRADGMKDITEPGLSLAVLAFF